MGSIDIPPFLQKQMKERLAANNSNLPPFLKKKEEDVDASTLPVVSLDKSVSTTSLPENKK